MENPSQSEDKPQSLAALAERLTPTQKGEIIRLSKVEAILADFINKHPNLEGHMYYTAFRNEEDAIVFLYTKKYGFYQQWHGPVDYLEMIRELKDYRPNTTSYFSDFPEGTARFYARTKDTPLLRELNSRLKKACELLPGEDNSQDVKIALKEHYKRQSLVALTMVKEGFHYYYHTGTMPSDYINATNYAKLAGITLDEPEVKAALKAFYVKSREEYKKAVSESKHNALEKMESWGTHIADADDYLNEKHSPELIELARLATSEALRVMRSNLREWFDKDFSKGGFDLYKKMALRWAEIAGINISAEADKLSSEMDEKLKPFPERLANKIKRKISGK